MDEKSYLEKSIEELGKFSRFGSRPGLERVSELLNRLGNPQKDLKVIHVAGTNGKGSVCRYVYSVLLEAGYRAGLFISPFIEEFNERIEVGGERIPPEELYEITCKVIEKSDGMVAEGLESPTEFEVLTAIAFEYYRKKQTEVVVLEVGLGGRGDSTNVIEKPMVSCITSISYDHMDRLGNTLAEIAREKAGIIKEGAPVVYYSEEPEVISVIEGTAGEKGSECRNISDFDYIIKEENPEYTIFDCRMEEELYSDIRITMPGKHQVTNAVCALKILSILCGQYGFSVPECALKAGIAEARQPGRIEIICRNPGIVLDGAHNRDSVRVLTEWIKKSFSKDDKLLIVTGVLMDKEYKLMAEMLADTGADFIVSEPENPRKLDAEKYAKVLKSVSGSKCKVTVIKNPADAAKAAYNCMTDSDNGNRYTALIFAGSLYLIGSIRPIIRFCINGGTKDESKHSNSVL